MTNKAYASGTVIDSGSLNDFNTATYNLLTGVAGTNTITATGPLSFSAYGGGKDFEFVPAVTNTGAVTININGLGARAITKYGTSPLVAGDLVAGAVVRIIDDGTRFQLLNPQVVPAAQGGTGFASYAIGDILYANTTTTLAKLPDVATGNVLRSGGVGVAPAWGKVALATDVSGTLPVANGGTGDTGTAWTDVGITVTPAAGAFGNASGRCRYKIVGKTAWFSVVVTIIVNGTGAGGVTAVLPFTAAAEHAYGGRESQTSGQGLIATILPSATNLSIFKYDNTYPGGNSYRLTISGVMEIQ